MKINKYILLVLALVAIFVVSCGDDDDKNSNTNTVVEFEEAPSFSESFKEANNSVTLITEETVRYHVANIIDGIFTVTMIETATDLIFIDVGPDSELISFLPILDEAGGELRAYANAIGKPLSIIMTHEHFDHWGGMASFQDVPVYAHSDVAPLLMASEGFTSRYGSTNVNAVSSSLELGGLTFTFDTIQNSETGENSYIYIENLQAVFVADLVYNRAHNYIREYTPLDGTDEIQNWLDGLAVLNEKFGTYAHIFCGHGGTTTDIPEVIRLNEEYLTIARNLINGSRPLTNGDIASTNNEVVDELLSLYPIDDEPFYKVSGSGFARPDALFPGDTGATWFE